MCVPYTNKKAILWIFFKVALLLKNKNLDINLKNANNDTPLICACYKGYGKILKLLLEFDDILLNEQNNHGISGFMYGCMNGNMEIIDLLISCQNLDFSLKDNTGKLYSFF